MNTRTAWIVYSLLRLAFFAVPFAALMLIGWPWWLSAIVATLVAVSLSVIFLAKPRQTAAQSITDWRNRDRTADDIAEDEAIEEADAHSNVEAVEEAEPDDAHEVDERSGAEGNASSGDLGSSGSAPR